MNVELITKEEFIQFEKRAMAMMEKLIAQFSGQYSNQQWVRTSQLVKILNLSPSSIQNMRNRGAIPFKKIEGTILYPLHEIMKQLND
jgi:hypothetical protein